jgi:putative two-component system response regulator
MMKPLLINDRADVLVLDDQLANLHLLLDLLAPEFDVHPFTQGEALLAYVRAGRPVDLVLLDVVMPPPDGFEVCARLRDMPEMEDVPIVFLSALDTPEDEARGLALGATDYLSVPYSAAIVLARVRHHMRHGRAMRLVVSQNDQLDRRVAERTAELVHRNAQLQVALEQVTRTQDATIVALSTLAEMRDHDTGRHVQRTRSYVRELALALRAREPALAPLLGDEAIATLYKSAPLHDIGKVAIPDQILNKPGHLDPAERAVMQTHARLGHDALRSAEVALGGADGFLRCAQEIALAHHEHWDGSGYPQGLAGEAIPLAARLMALADTYDALVSPRVYKAALGPEDTQALIVRERGRRFDPRVVDAFVAVSDRFVAIAQEFGHARR